MRVVKITAEEYDTLQKAGAWVHWRYPDMHSVPNPTWQCAVCTLEHFDMRRNIEFYTRLDDEQDASHGDEASTY